MSRQKKLNKLKWSIGLLVVAIGLIVLSWLPGVSRGWQMVAIILAIALEIPIWLLQRG